MDSSLLDMADQWLSGEGALVSTVVSCRTRFARNLQGLPFPPRARNIALKHVADAVRAAVEHNSFFHGMRQILLDGFSENDRRHLRESQIISQEMERGGDYRMVYFGGSPFTAFMVNEEDHLRIFILMPGLQIQRALERLIETEAHLAERLDFAFSEQLGYLTACPTNTGTALRISAMMHLPALAVTEQIEKALESIPSRGMAVRGIYGENSPHLGNFYQISNETTLGMSERQIADRLDDVIAQLADKELSAREMLFSEKRTLMEDKLYRSLSLLASSRIINTQEAIENLSVLRLGIDRGFLPGLTHTILNRLIVRVQPGHLQREKGINLTAENRDIARATLLRHTFGDMALNSN
ncbi:MAG: ATP--guanido phosphotransferase [Candidatus Sumerlaeota bacterium]|nr:ATP--guanido phosphotransferase [Candidatus Sumerlaeota bacterium]